MSNIINGTAGGQHVTGTPLTTTLTSAAAPGLLRNAIDERIVHVRPMSTPIDQLSRCAGARRCGSMEVEYYAVDTKPTESLLVTEIEAGEGQLRNGRQVVFEISTENDEIFEVSETLLLPDVLVPDASKPDAPGEPLVLYVVAKSGSGLEVTAVNGIKISNKTGLYPPEIPEGASVIRMGRAAAELDVQTAQFEALPHKRSNYCQIFKMQVEESTFQKIANKEVGWTFSDQEEAAIIDMRLGLEKNFLFGQRARIYDPEKREEIMLTGGIWSQAAREIPYTPGALDAAALISMCRQAFTNNAGSHRKILIGGSALIEALSNVDYNRVITAGETLTKWGIEFNEIRSKFGSLYVIHSEIFDQCGHASDGFILDPEYVTKYCHVPFQTEKLDLRSAGTRNTDAIVITEASCLVLRYPDAHARVVAQ